jgi:hypothetical protein
MNENDWPEQSGRVLTAEDAAADLMGVARQGHELSNEAINAAIDAWFDEGEGPEDLEPQSISAFFEERMRRAINAALAVKS